MIKTLVELEQREQQLLSELRHIRGVIYKKKHSSMGRQFSKEFGFGIGSRVEVVIDRPGQYYPCGTTLQIESVLLYDDEWSISLQGLKQPGKGAAIIPGYRIQDILPMREAYLNSYGLSGTK